MPLTLAAWRLLTAALVERRDRAAWFERLQNIRTLVSFLHGFGKVPWRQRKVPHVRTRVASSSSQEGGAVPEGTLDQAASDSGRDQPAPAASVSATIVLLDKDCRIRRVERADAAGISRPRSELAGQMVGDALCCVETKAEGAVCGLAPGCSECSVRRVVNKTFQLGAGQIAVPARYRRRAAGRTVERSVSITTVPMDGLGAPLVLVHIEDITDQQRAYEALRASEAKFRIVAENTYAWEFWAGPDYRFLYSSPSCERITGHTAAEFQADPDLLLRLVHPEDRPGYEAHRRAAREGQEAGEREFRIVRPDGAVRWIQPRVRAGV